MKVIKEINMNLQELKTIINSGLPEEVIESEVINILSKDEDIILILMKLLEKERQFKKKMYQEMNLLLSKADVGLDNPEINEGNFMQKEISEFYIKYKGYLGHCFRQFIKQN